MPPAVPPAITDRLLINRITLRGPEMERIFRHVRRHPGVSYEALVERYVPPEPGVFSPTNDELLKDAIGFMLTAGVLALESNSNAWAKRTFVVPPDLPTDDFRLELLAALRAQPDPRQRAVAGVHDHLAGMDVVHVPANHTHRWMERSEWGGLFSWNEEKTRLVVGLYSYLGLVVPLEDNGYMCIPRLALVKAIFKQVRKEAAAGARMPIRDVLEAIETSYFACFTAKGRVHRGLAFALEEMADRGMIRLRHQADSARSVLVGTRRVSEVEFSWDA